MSKVYLMEHPLVRHKVTMLRDKNTSTKDFRELAEEISLLISKITWFWKPCGSI